MWPLESDGIDTQTEAWTEFVTHHENIRNAEPRCPNHDFHIDIEEPNVCDYCRRHFDPAA